MGRGGGGVGGGGRHLNLSFEAIIYHATKEHALGNLSLQTKVAVHLFFRAIIIIISGLHQSLAVISFGFRMSHQYTLKNYNQSATFCSLAREAFTIDSNQHKLVY